MGRLPKATKRRALIKRFKKLGWTGPHKGTGKHPEYMAKGTQVVKIPNPHSKGGSDIGEGLLKTILDQASIDVDEWLDGPSDAKSSADAPEQQGEQTADGPEA